MPGPAPFCGRQPPGTLTWQCCRRCFVVPIKIIASVPMVRRRTGLPRRRCPLSRRSSACTWWAALSRSSRRAGSITPAMSTTARAVRSPSTARSISLISTLPAGSASESRTPSPPAIRLPPLRRSLAPWGFVSALTCALRNSPAACACGVPGSFSSRRPST